MGHACFQFQTPRGQVPKNGSCLFPVPNSTRAGPKKLVMPVSSSELHPAATKKWSVPVFSSEALQEHKCSRASQPRRLTRHPAAPPAWHRSLPAAPPARHRSHASPPSPRHTEVGILLSKSEFRPRFFAKKNHHRASAVLIFDQAITCIQTDCIDRHLPPSKVSLAALYFCCVGNVRGDLRIILSV